MKDEFYEDDQTGPHDPAPPVLPVAASVKVVTKHTLVKWDSETEPPEGTDPIGHPSCIEVLEVEDGKINILYRRADPCR